MMIEGVRIAFPALFRPVAMKADDPKKYGLKIILDKVKDKGQIKNIRKAIEECAKAKWGDDIPPFKKCLTDGSEHDQYDGIDDTKMTFNATNQKRPTVIDRDRTPLSEEDGKPYGGCYCNVTIEFWGQDNQWGKRVNASLTGVQFVKDGEAFGGGAAAADVEDFDILDEEEAEEDFLN